MDLGISDKVAIVSGGSTGIGLAIAKRLVTEGAKVIVSSSNQERVNHAAQTINATDGIVWDTNDIDGAARLVNLVTKRYGCPQIVICNTGGPPAADDPLDLTDEQWQQANLNLVRAPMALLRAALPQMQAKGFGRVINVVSTSVREPIPNLMLSNAERSAALAAFKTLSRRYAADGITINSLLTGLIATDRLASLFGSLEAANQVAEATVPAKRLGDPDEMASAAAFLCSKQAAYITGVALPVDGGRLAGVW